ncbi:MAG: class I SAM-dependent methyltransferase [Thermoguttaceae bacterium]
MFNPDDYQLLDFGDGRRLERFGAFTLDRPCPAVEGVARADPDAWPRADARFQRTDAERGSWTFRRPLPNCWTITHRQLVFEVKPTLFGHLGVFPEQADNWDWIAAHWTGGDRPLRVLNLFAYTGGSTLAAALAGAEVVHVDAARNIVAWARRNAAHSGLADRPVRWIVEDAAKFVKREFKRGNRYDAVILDPPSYGHGAHGEVWRLSAQLPRLLQLCDRLTAPQCRFLLLTCHTPGFDAARLQRTLSDALGHGEPGRWTAEDLELRTAAGRILTSGAMVRWAP